ncbi:hypothetical protein AA0113_g9020 [Alternaria arborescens]|uniref:Uncharacterized protein n=1 Tax=Alternaria arborescens TaxID=156630 RepID=A0A4Q4RFB2_9PLEO|nr:hypothetical protein AA0111_g9134 [Alternaria arborescens]RYN40696.1 hypothetical protein AA0112_g2795 [Alternaria arborescens]RYO22869.1 hypothetical protein AA0111_g9134 [Alternaria arborescens]RYO55373.1 hypothetical protein AA0113_g9020 [Alternaria arborescens]
MSLGLAGSSSPTAKPCIATLFPHQYPWTPTLEQELNQEVALQMNHPHPAHVLQQDVARIFRHMSTRSSNVKDQSTTSADYPYQLLLSPKHRKNMNQAAIRNSTGGVQ